MHYHVQTFSLFIGLVNTTRGILFNIAYQSKNRHSPHIMNMDIKVHLLNLMNFILRLTFMSLSLLYSIFIFNFKKISSSDSPAP